MFDQMQFICELQLLLVRNVCVRLAVACLCVCCTLHVCCRVCIQLLTVYNNFQPSGVSSIFFFLLRPINTAEILGIIYNGLLILNRSHNNFVILIVLSIVCFQFDCQSPAFILIVNRHSTLSPTYSRLAYMGFVGLTCNRSFLHCCSWIGPDDFN